MRIIGVDGGLSGGLALLEDGRLVDKCVMPVIDAPNGKGHEYDGPEICNLFSGRWKPDHVILEKAFVMPKQSSTGGLTIGKNYGIMLGILIALKLPYTIVTPQKWQKLMFEGLAKGDTKACSLIIARRLWPSEDWRATPKCKKMHDGMTDAAVIAEFGWRTIANRPLMAVLCPKDLSAEAVHVAPSPW